MLASIWSVDFPAAIRIERPFTNAGPQRIVDLLTTTSNRMVIPVYQRAYSWDEGQCQQLWDDIVAIGRRGEGTHFTGSVVMVLDGTPDFSGMSRVLVIDGQQRITTLTLLLVALAEFARDNPDKVSHFSFEEIMGSGYLVSPYKKGDDHYRLTEYSTQLVPPFYESGTASLYEAVPPFYEKGTGLIPVPFLLLRLQACRVLAHVRPLDI